jgi:hypothetical protein
MKLNILRILEIPLKLPSLHSPRIRMRFISKLLREIQMPNVVLNSLKLGLIYRCALDLPLKTLELKLLEVKCYVDMPITYKYHIRGIRRRPVAVPFCLPQIPPDLG